MKLQWWTIYILIFANALFFSFVFTPLSEFLGKKYGLLDVPKKNKIHAKVKARSGGVGIFLSFMITIIAGSCIGLWLYRSDGVLHESVSGLIGNIPAVSSKLLWLLVGATFIFIVGLIDDRFTLSPWPKLICQLLSAVPLLIADIRIQMFLPEWMGIALTVFWIVLLSNSFNFLDNMDGLTSGIAVIVSGVSAFIAWQAGNLFITAMFIAFAGSIIGFWYFNFIRSRLFMGDGGSLFIGYMIAALTIQSTYYKQGVPTGLPVLTPLIILGVPLFDTASVLLIRLKNRKPLMQGDTNHFSHRLVNLGMTRKQAVIFIYLVTVCVAVSAVPLGYLPLKPALVMTGQVVLWFILIFLLEHTGRKNNDN